MERLPGGKGDGIIERYEINGAILQQYDLRGGAAVDLLEEKYPTAMSITRNRGEGRYVVIHKFDDEAFRVLSELASDPSYWRLMCEYKKIS
jgi:hypothetical protein